MFMYYSACLCLMGVIRRDWEGCTKCPNGKEREILYSGGACATVWSFRGSDSGFVWTEPILDECACVFSYSKWRVVRRLRNEEAVKQGRRENISCVVVCSV